MTVDHEAGTIAPNGLDLAPRASLRASARPPAHCRPTPPVPAHIPDHQPSFGGELARPWREHERHGAARPETVPFSPQQAEPDGKTAYVAAGPVVVPIRTATNTALKPIKLHAQGAFGIAITPNGKLAYTSNYLSHSVTPIRIATNTALKPIKAGTFPDAIAIAPTLASPCHSCV